MAEVDFYCRHCKLDQRTQKWGYIYEFRGNGRRMETKCEKCKSKIYRFTSSEAKSDPYYRESKNVRIMMSRHSKDLIQPSQEGFKTYYKKQWEEFQKTEEKIYQKHLEEKEERDVFLKKYWRGSGYRDLAVKALDAEDKYLNART